MKTNLIVSLIITACLTAAAQTNTTTTAPAAGLYGTLQSVLDVNNTNGLIHASELNLTPLFKWDSQERQAGGALRADWWVTDQQGMTVCYSEFETRRTTWAVGYQARTVFKSVELSVGTGVLQDTANLLGTTRIYIEPALTLKIPVKFADIRFTGGATVCNSESPTAFVGLTFRFHK
jgi:hypothetical protein